MIIPTTKVTFQLYQSQNTNAQQKLPSILRLLFNLSFLLPPCLQAGDNVFASVCLSVCVCLSVTKISQEQMDIFRFPFTGIIPHTRGRTD